LSVAGEAAPAVANGNEIATKAAPAASVPATNVRIAFIFTTPMDRWDFMQQHFNLRPVEMCKAEPKTMQSCVKSATEPVSARRLCESMQSAS
jgi:hypothetical protein